MKIAYGASRTTKKWSNKEVDWFDFLKRLEIPVRTPESVNEYQRMRKSERDAIKDKGGYVFGHLLNGKRTINTVACRSAITLDVDFATDELMTVFDNKFKNEGCLYSTHSHTTENPRYRIIIPLKREITSDEYEAISRLFVHEHGIIEAVDDTSYQCCRLMYFPSCPSNGEYVFKAYHGELLNPDEYLAKYFDWRDIALYPTSSRQSAALQRNTKEAADPTTKRGVVGAFCRVFSCEDAIERFLSDVYESSVIPNRYSYKFGESTAGLVIYDDKWAYSFHATDPANSRLLNAFDLVAIHKYGVDMDDDKRYRNMSDYAMGLSEVHAQMAADRLEQAEEEFKPEENWGKDLEYEKNGSIKATYKNIVLILQNDKKLQGIRRNELSEFYEIVNPPWGNMPWHPNWRDEDSAALVNYLSLNYGIYKKDLTENAFICVAMEKNYHPIREYLENLPEWDGIPRIETLLMDYLGADNTEYVKMVTKKALAAAIARIKSPGIKFDYVLTLNGPQGAGKSTLFEKLGGKWFSDGLTIEDMAYAKNAENLKGFWILELSELSGLKKSEAEAVKSFVSRQVDNYRPAYGRYLVSNPRQCILVGTVNGNDGFLRDMTGNRRFWVVSITGKAKKRIWDMSDDERDQIWAEAKVIWDNGESLYLPENIEKISEEKQIEALEIDSREGIVSEYLAKLLPSEWHTMDLYQRREFMGDNQFNAVGINKRVSVCPMEIWSEVFKKDPAMMEKKDSYSITMILKRLGWVNTDERPIIPIYGRQRIWRDKK